MTDGGSTALLAGRRALVTGGASGIGAAVVHRLAGHGAVVAVLDRRAEAARTVAAEVDGTAVVADVADGAAVAAAVAEAVDALGGLDLVVANAGVGDLRHLHDYDERAWDLLVDVNLKGVWHTLASSVGPLRAAGGGTVVTVASGSALRPTRGEAPYSAAKAGVVALTAGAALEYGPDIRVNCVSPGVIATPLTSVLVEDPGAAAVLEAGTPLGRAGTPEEVADAVVYLSSPLSSFVTGHNLVVDGGALLPTAAVDATLARWLGD